MYYLPIFIDKRRIEYLKLEPQLAEPLAGSQSFVIEKGDLREVEVFRFINGVKLISSFGTSYDQILFARSPISYEIAVEDNCITIQFTQTEQSYQFSKQDIAQWQELLEPEDLWAKVKDRNIEFGAAAKLGASQLTFVLQFTDLKGQVFSASFQMNLGPPEKLVEAVFDFGSEASQIAYQFRSSRHREDLRFNILGSLYHDYYRNLESEKATAFTPPDEKLWQSFLQYAAEDDKLFVSNFFIKSFNEEDDSENRVSPRDALAAVVLEEPFENGKEGIVQILGKNLIDSAYFTDSTKGHYQMIPNLKLMEMGYMKDFRIYLGEGSVHFSREKEFVFQRLVNQFLHVLLRKIDQENHAKDKLLRLTLLVPNIYAQHRIYQLIKSTTSDLQRMIQKYGFGFAGVEVSSISESDASFLGMLSDNEVKGLRTNKMQDHPHYLIVDAGKGTIDLSVIATTEQYNSFAGDFRSGFAGSGNAITFAFLETIVAFVVGHENQNLRQRLFQKIIESGSYYSHKIMKACERLKQNYGDGMGANNIDYHDLDAAVIDNVKANFKFKDSPDLALEHILQFLTDGLNKKNLSIGDYYGFIEATVNDIVNRVIDMVRTSGKETFPLVVFSGRGFYFEPLRSGLEAQLKAEFKTSTFLFSRGKAKESCLYGPFNYNWGVNKNSGQVGVPVIVSAEGTVGKAVRRLFGGKKKGESETYSTEGLNLNAFDFYLKGKDFPYDGDRIEVSGVEIAVPPEIAEKKNLNIIFVGEDFLLRTPEYAVAARPNMGAIGRDPLAMKSVFPHVGIADILFEVVPKSPSPTVKQEPETPAPIHQENPVRVTPRVTDDGLGIMGGRIPEAKPKPQGDPWEDQIDDLI